MAVDVNQAVRFYKGTNVRVARILYDQFSDDTLDLTGYSNVKLQVALTTATATAALVFNVACTVSGDPSAGTVFADFAPGDTASKIATDYIACIKVTYSSGVIVKSDPFDFSLWESVEAAA